MVQRISAFIFSSLFVLLPLQAQEGTARRVVQQEMAKTVSPSLFNGAALSVEVGSPLAHVLGTDALNAEVGLRLNFKNKYFPLAELGYSKYDATHKSTLIHYQTSAPYLRLGLDINMLRDKLQENRLMAGFRIGYSNYKFDVDGPSATDPVWGNGQAFAYQGLGSNRLWLEVGIGLESEIFRHFHMGFSIRYRQKLHEKTLQEANSYYVPGFGNTDNGFKATYNLFFDLTKKVKPMNTEKK